ncbi:MAG: hypothetical protein JWM12_2308 [Ilumatobacteraceae bacterium]|nr:hypothetical protein [Ilumatobacteraceae bacterium]
MRSLRSFRRALAGALLLAVGLVAVPAGSHVGADSSLAGGGEFHPLAPARIFDSRTYDGGPINDPSPGLKPISLANNTTFDVAVLGQGSIPTDASKVLAVAVSITVSGSTSAGVLAAYGAGAKPASLSSLLNFNTGDVVSNLAILSPGTDGKLTVALYGGTGSAQVLIDVFGWFSTSAQGSGADNGSRLIPVNPGRILDTRDGTNLPGAAPIGPGGSITVPVRGVSSVRPSVANVVPNDPNVVGVLLNVVGITDRTGGASTYLAVTPDAVPAGGAPTTSNVNLPPAAIKANLVMLPVGADGNVHVFNLFGLTDVAIDVVGYLIKGSDAASLTGRVVPLSAPFRTFDTREQQWGKAPIGPGVAESWSFSDFVGSVKINGVAVGDQSAVIGNLTNASLQRQYATVPVLSYLTAWPTGQPRPETSNVDTNEKPIAVPNMSIINYGPNVTVQFFNYAGKADYLFDASAVVLK